MRDDSLWRMLSVVGLSMMKPIAPGSNWLGHIGDALGTGMAYQMMQESAGQTQANKQRELDIKETEAGADTALKRARAASETATLPGKLATQTAHIAQLYTDMANTKDTMASRQLKRQIDMETQALEREFGRPQAQAALDQARANVGRTEAQTRAAGQKGDSGRLKAINDAAKRNRDPLTGKLNINGMVADLDAAGVQHNFRPPSAAMVAEGQARIKSGKNKAEQDAFRQQLNDRLQENDMYPVF